MGKLI